MRAAPPRLSIGLPVFNGARYLSQTLAAMLGQSFGNFELIISDNASSDATPEIASEAAARDSRVTFFRNTTNVGAAGNFNRVLELASAPLFKWACADDQLVEGFLDAAVRHLDAHPEAVACYGAVTLIDAEGNALGDYDQDLDLRMPSVAERFRRATERGGLLHVLQGIMRTVALRRTGGYKAFPGSDEVLVAELALNGQIHEIRERMMLRRMHPEAASAATTVEEKLAHLDPSRRETFLPYYWSHSIEYLRAVARAPLAPGLKLAMMGGVLRRMVSIRDHLAREAGQGLRHATSRFARRWR